MAVLFPNVGLRGDAALPLERNRLAHRLSVVHVWRIARHPQDPLAAHTTAAAALAPDTVRCAHARAEREHSLVVPTRVVDGAVRAGCLFRAPYSTNEVASHC